MHSDRSSVVPATWLVHDDDDCSICNCAVQMKKGGRPKKVKRGKKPDPSMIEPKTPIPLQDIDTLVSKMPSLTISFKKS